MLLQSVIIRVNFHFLMPFPKAQVMRFQCLRICYNKHKWERGIIRHQLHFHPACRRKSFPVLSSCKLRGFTPSSFSQRREPIIQKCIPFHIAALLVGCFPPGQRVVYVERDPLNYYFATNDPLRAMPNIKGAFSDVLCSPRLNEPPGRGF